MAEKVAEWPEKYGCDGIDLDIEDGAGDAKGAGKNMIHFVRKLKQLQPKMIIGQPTYGYPAVIISSLSVVFTHLFQIRVKTCRNIIRVSFFISDSCRN